MFCKFASRIKKRDVSMLNFLKNWTLPVAMLVGALGYFIFANFAFLEPTKPFMGSFVSYLTPALIFAQLLLTFCKVRPHELMPSPWHGWLLLFQLVSASLVGDGLPDMPDGNGCGCYHRQVGRERVQPDDLHVAVEYLGSGSRPADVPAGGASCRHNLYGSFPEDIEQGVPFAALPVRPGDAVPLFLAEVASFPVGFS